MAISLSVTPSGLSGLAEASPLVPASLPAATATSVFAALGGAPDTVALSDVGRLLSASATFQNDLGLPRAGAVAPLTATPLAPATTQAVAASEEIDSGGSASAATLALQRLLADPARNARNKLLDPAYAWLTGAFHVGDFALPGQTIDPNAGLPDFPPPILPVAPVDGIAYYKEAAEDTRSRVARHVNHLV